ncbi:hypothetical protein Fot_48235 [Forsythia ovata]|uniref:Uncharacterized protein n=1 Tax=Forsythia ovata TaxID=205694 RepID=A0ABD1QTI5_9LAMI
MAKYIFSKISIFSIDKEENDDENVTLFLYWTRHQSQLPLPGWHRGQPWAPHLSFSPKNLYFRQRVSDGRTKEKGLSMMKMRIVHQRGIRRMKVLGEAKCLLLLRKLKSQLNLLEVGREPLLLLLPAGLSTSTLGPVRMSWIRTE